MKTCTSFTRYVAGLACACNGKKCLSCQAMKVLRNVQKNKAHRKNVRVIKRTGQLPLVLS